MGENMAADPRGTRLGSPGEAVFKPWESQEKDSTVLRRQNIGRAGVTSQVHFTPRPQQTHRNAVQEQDEMKPQVSQCPPRTKPG